MISSKIVLTSTLSIILILIIAVETIPVINAEWKIPTKTESKQHVTYENNLLKFDYPYGWKFTENENSVVFYPKNQAADRINITTIGIPSKSVSMKAIIDLTLDEFAKNLKDKNYPSFIDNTSMPNKGLLYRVGLGPFKDLDTAINNGEMIKDNENLSYWIIKK